MFEAACRWKDYCAGTSIEKSPLAGGGASRPCFPAMNKVKDTLRATVRLGYDGRVHKQFRGPKAEERFTNEVKVLKYLEERGCPFVPRLLEADPVALKMVTTNCGSRVDHLDEERCRELFEELQEFGVRHDDPDMRNVTYRQTDGRFCLVDFEFATILDHAR
jgi:tRNA A-37 threonylcarbamoyl transferase component Bud32